MKSNYFLLVFILLNFSVFAQSFTPSIGTEISIITIGPGDQLYDKFGHSAFRVHDPIQGIDIAYNYGVYDFDTPNFYTKFAQGKLNYKLAVSYFDPFLETYVLQDRWVKEQVLNLNYEEKLALFNFLQNNAKPENQYYLYDFFYDNCATKMRDVAVAVLGNSLRYNHEYLTVSHTLRELIQKNVVANSWGSLGMDVAIGSVVDVEATPWEHQFLPEYIFKAASHATIERNGEIVPFVLETRSLYEVQDPDRSSGNFFLSPLFVFGLLGGIILWITIRNIRSGNRSRCLDGLIFGITGIIGIFLSLLWFATDHTTTANNYNLLWAFPFSLLFAFAISSRKPRKWLEKYVLFLLLLFALLVIHWFTGVQSFAIGLLPLFIALVIRYAYLFSYLKKLNRQS